MLNVLSKKQTFQYESSKKKLHEFKEVVKVIHKKYSDKNKSVLLCQGYIEHIAQLKSEIGEYEKNKDRLNSRVIAKQSKLLQGKKN